MGYRERIKKAKTLEEAKSILAEAKLHASAKSVRRCELAFSQLPFKKEE